MDLSLNSLSNNEKVILINIRGIVNFPEFYDFIERFDAFYIIERLIGPSIDSLVKIYNGKFNLFTTNNIGIALMKNIEILYNQGYLHREIKPNNIVFVSLSRNNIQNITKIDLLDFWSSTSLKENVKNKSNNLKKTNK